MVGDGGARHGKAAADLSGGLGSVLEQIQYRPTGGVGQGLKGVLKAHSGASYSIFRLRSKYTLERPDCQEKYLEAGRNDTRISTSLSGLAQAICPTCWTGL
ncbi:hypothetical protein SDC9_159040 [bioreactor metagenome]|uniref:Uncharacterized protein n=1 Tax=bioreactor metagenome TaxID=1076179 RepID=A0A645FE50_9ZZZZ